MPWRRPWTSSRTAARNLVEQEAISRHQSLSAFGVQVCFTVLADDAPGERTGRTRPQRRRESTVPSCVPGKVDDAKQSTEDLDTEETDRERRDDGLLAQILSRCSTCEQCELPQTVLDKTADRSRRLSTIRSTRPNGIIAAMPNPRPEIQRAGSKAFYSPITDRITLRASRAFREALKNTAPQRCMRPCTAPVIRSVLREKAFAKSLRLVSPSTQKEEFIARKWEPPTLCAEAGITAAVIENQAAPRTWLRLAQKAPRRSQAPESTQPRRRSTPRTYILRSPARRLKIGGARAMRGRPLYY